MKADGPFHLGSWLVQPSLNRMTKRGTTRYLRRQVMDLAVLLATHAGRVVTRDEILDAVWGTRFVSPTALPRCLAELRAALGDDARCPAFIETIPKRGYRAIAPVRPDASGGSGTRQPSVLVMPFRDLTAGGGQQYLCEGLAEQLLNRLARAAGLRVIARNSIVSSRRRHGDLAQLCASLDVQRVVEGSVCKTGQRLRVTIEILDVGSHSYVWSQTHDGSVADVFDLQDRVALDVVDQLNVEVLDFERARLSARTTSRPEAHTWYLKGLYHWNQRTREGFDLSQSCFKNALECDPRYALPSVALANVHMMAAFYGLQPGDRALPRARRLLDAALTIDPRLPEAQAALGMLAFFANEDWPSVEACFRRALVLGPNHATTSVWYALCCSWAGQTDKASDILDRAYWSDPLSTLVGAARGVLSYQAEHYDEALEQLRQVLELDPAYSLAHLHLARTLSALGRFDEAATCAQRGAELGLTCCRGVLVYAVARAGDLPRARHEMVDLLRGFRAGRVQPGTVAYGYLGLREAANTRRWVAIARTRRDPLVCQLPADPLFREIALKTVRARHSRGTSRPTARARRPYPSRGTRLQRG